VERIERENRRWRRGAVALGVLAIAAAALGGAQKPRVPELVSARTIAAVDEKGRQRVYLTADEKVGPSVWLMRETGAVGISLSLGPGEAPSLSIADSKGNDRLSLEADDADGGSVTVYDAARRPVAKLPSR
jgi:hypothetical protein